MIHTVQCANIAIPYVFLPMLSAITEATVWGITMVSQ